MLDVHFQSINFGKHIPLKMQSVQITHVKNREVPEDLQQLAWFYLLMDIVNARFVGKCKHLN